MPGTIFSLPGEQELLVSFPAKDIATQVREAHAGLRLVTSLHERLSHTAPVHLMTQISKLGRVGWACHVFEVEVKGAEGEAAKTVRALVRLGHCYTERTLLCHEVIT